MKKGQALVEFIIILPILLFMLLGVIDLGRIFYLRINLEEQIGEVIELDQEGKSLEEIKKVLDKDVEIEKKSDREYINYTLEVKVDIITPGLNLIFDNPYNLKVSRSIFNE